MIEPHLFAPRPSPCRHALRHALMHHPRRHAVLRRRPIRVLCVLLAALAIGSVFAADTPRFFWHPEIAPSGPVVVVISLDEQNIYVYRNGVAIGVGPISSGRPGHETPPGVYSILQKAREHRSTLYDDAPMPYMQRLTWDGIALHGGVLPGHPASHGCVRLPQSFAEKLYAITQRGGIVVVADARVSPASITHPAAVAPIDLTGQPMPDAAGPPVDTDTDALAVAGAPVSVVVSTYDRMAYVLRGGLLIARSPLEMAPDSAPSGTLLYLMTGARPALAETAVTQAMPRWSAYRVLGDGPVPEPGEMAALLHVPQAFGQRLRVALVPGSTVLVTDLPGHGESSRPPYATLLESDQAASSR